MNILINACARKDSRTKVLADILLNKLGEYETINLYDLNLKPIDEDFINRRNKYIADNDYSDLMFDIPKKIAKADNLVIAAPFWDGSFPSILKVFIENIYAMGILTSFDEKGMPLGLCKGNTVYYVSTCGGPFIENFGYDYIKYLFVDTFGYKKAKLIKADMLDVVGFDADEIMKDTIKEIEEL